MTNIHERLENNLNSFMFDVSEVQDVVKERYKLLENSLSSFKMLIELKILGRNDLISTNVKKIYELFFGLHKHVDCFLSAKHYLFKYVRAFNIEYKAYLEKKNDSDIAIF